MSENVIMVTQPLANWEPDDVRGYSLEHREQKALASVMSMVCNKVGWLHHELNDDPPTVTMEQYKKWEALQKELLAQVIAILEAEMGKQTAPENTGWYKRSAPSMARNGFINANGWWRPAET